MKQIKFKPIEEKDMNDRLVNLYGSHIPYLYPEIEKIYLDDNYKEFKAALPLLIELPENPWDTPYESADIKVMIFGRETNNWNDGNRNDKDRYTEYSTYNFHLENSEDILTEIKGKYTDEYGNPLSMDKEMPGITDTYISYLYARDEETGKRIYRGKSQLTKSCYNFIDSLQEKLPDKKIQFVWNNLYKIGKSKPGKGNSTDIPPREFIDIEKKNFDVISEEIKILKPDIIIFMTGKHADSIIADKFGLENTSFETINQDVEELKRISIPGIKYAARTKHPSDRSYPNVLRKQYNDVLVEDIIKTLNL